MKINHEDTKALRRAKEKEEQKKKDKPLRLEDTKKSKRFNFFYQSKRLRINHQDTKALRRAKEKEKQKKRDKPLRLEDTKRAKDFDTESRRHRGFKQS